MPGKNLETQNNMAWAKLFEKYDILSHIQNDGCFVITADQIREFREPRLMAKFDHSVNLPAIFSDNQISILPISRGSYILSTFNPYCLFPNSVNQDISVTLPPLQSLNLENISSESVALNCAMASGILNRFLGENHLFATASGRMSSGNFNFHIKNERGGDPFLIDVNNSQIEIDAAYEGQNSLAIIEAKMDLSDDFLVRQLYYPYRTWSARISKPVRPIFLVYSNGNFTLYEYKFNNPDYYNSISLVKCCNYHVQEEAITLDNLVGIYNGTSIVDEPDIPFPQANSFRRIVNLCELLKSGNLTREEITEQYAFDERQTRYYTDAGRYLGFILRSSGQSNTTIYSLSPQGRAVMGLPLRQRQLEFCRAMLSHQIFHNIFEITIKEGYIPDAIRIADEMEKCTLYHVSSRNTFVRRASTIKNWLTWMFDLVDN